MYTISLMSFYILYSHIATVATDSVPETYGHRFNLT